ncbi:hypothetical protein CC78DRAFT_497879 [Lojkania enalia]|uniref:Ribosomal protein L9 domain-containing protein n=1 Tax=Lojkania enalia TaxID=147567 RepID=A0A9P4K618_9PLEO|nr:hypothetical protein CC78DRAFT_497879 [Didymosphaeria enalia]
MASLRTPALLPQCSSCVRKVTRQTWDVRGSLQQARSKTKAAREAERNIIVKLLQDVPKFGRAGSLVPVNPATMRNRWFPTRLANYVPFTQLKQLKAQGVDMVRDFNFGVQRSLEEVGVEVDKEDMVQKQRTPYVRPVEIELLSPERSMELLTAFIPPTVDFARQPIEQEKVDVRPRRGVSDAADILTAAAMASRPKPDENGIYGSVSASDVVATLKSALAHNDEAARVILTENDIRFVEGHAEGDNSKVKKLGTFKMEIQVPGAEEPITRMVRVRAKES